jgi:hypothetical protein
VLKYYQDVSDMAAASYETQREYLMEEKMAKEA